MTKNENNSYEEGKTLAELTGAWLWWCGAGAVAWTAGWVSTTNHMAAVTAAITWLLWLWGIRLLKTLNAEAGKKFQEDALVSCTGAVGQKTVGIWIKTSGESWPPLSLWLTSDNVRLPAKDCPHEMRELAAKILATTPESENQAIGEVLRSAGATHPIDIDGANTNKTILQWIETIIGTQPASPG
jgi:hypothetical protein